MRKLLLFYTFVVVLLISTSCSTPKSEEPKLTLKDSLMLVLKEAYGDTIGMKGYPGHEYLVFQTDTVVSSAYQTAEKVANRFDKLIRSQRTVSKPGETLRTAKLYEYYSVYDWETYDCEVELFVNLIDKYISNDSMRQDLAFKASFLYIEK